MAKFEVLPNRSGQYYWRLKADNGEIVAVSESYASKYNARRGAELVQSLAGRAYITEVEAERRLF